MIVKVEDILKDAMGLCNAIEIDETPSSSEMNIALRAANMMLDHWSSQRLMLRSRTSIAFTLSANKASYTIGSTGADITAPKIISIDSGYVTDAQVDHPLEVVTKEIYDNMQDKNVSQSRPIYVAYDPGAAQQVAQKGIFLLYYTPDKPYPCILECNCYLTEFVNLTDTVTFEPAYYETLVYNLSLRLWRRYNDNKTPVPIDIEFIAKDGLHSIKAMNSTTVIAGMDLPGKVTKYNVYTDGY